MSTGWVGFDFEPFLDCDRCDRSKVVEIADDVHRYHNSKDRASAADFKHHAPRCFGEEAVNGTPSLSGSIHSLFARHARQPVRCSTQALKYG